MKRNLPLTTCAILAALITSASATVTMDWVTVGDPGNAIDPLTGYGAVAYEYRIGKYEVTNAQYGQFLNAKGQSNSNNIYDPVMASYGITQSGNSGSFTYNVTTALANRPVVYISWFDAARFANWMMNGQADGSTETGAYTLNGANSGIILANAEAQVHIPSANEWYKAAYYNSLSQTYYLYPNGQNTLTTEDANYASNTTTDVGMFINYPSPYDTFDQGGNVFEWNDAESSGGRGIRGGAWINQANDKGGLSSLNNFYCDPVARGIDIGFRVASVPEPTSLLLTMLAGGMMLIRRKR